MLEIGTWYGGGSTKLIAEALKESKKSDCVTNETHHCCSAFVSSFELFRPAYEFARRYHNSNPVWFIHGSTVGVDGMLKEDDISEDDKGDHFKLFYVRDRDLMSNEQPRLALPYRATCRSRTARWQRIHWLGRI